MIRFTVVWLREFENELAHLWSTQADRSAISNAANLIDLELATDAQQKGHPVGDGLRVLVVPPLEVLFEVSTDDRIVRVVELHHNDPSRVERN